MLTFGSLFSGIGGIDLGLERAGWTCKWQVEIDPFCRKVLEKHWPHVPKFGDIKELTGNELTRVDLLAGGFPCQDVSLAGKGAGLEGDRSGLWFEYLRLIRALRPRWVLVENVPGLLVRGIETVLGGLAEAGYDSTWFSIQASDFGAPHKRDRVIVLAHSEISCQWPGLCQNEQRRQRRGRFGDSGSEDVENSISERLQGLVRSGQGWQTNTACGSGKETRLTQSLLGGVFDGLSGGMDRYRWPAGPEEEQHDWEPPRVAKGIKGRAPRLKGLGNAVVPDMAELVGWIIREIEEGVA